MKNLVFIVLKNQITGTTLVKTKHNIMAYYLSILLNEKTQKDIREVLKSTSELRSPDSPGLIWGSKKIKG